MDHPVSDAKINSLFPEYVDMIMKRLQIGAVQYGDASFSSDPVKLCKEVEQEILDISGWAFCLFCRLRDISSALPKIAPKPPA